jgi:uncharacterized protein (DUF1330 family)
MTDDQHSAAYFVILDVAIRDVERYLTYMERVAPALEAAGGRYLARGGVLTTYEGDWRPPRIVLIEFPSQAAFESFYYGAAYEGIREIRDEVSTGRMIGVEGLPPGAPPISSALPAQRLDALERHGIVERNGPSGRVRSYRLTEKGRDLESGRLVLDGPRSLVRAFPTWIAPARSPLPRPARPQPPRGQRPAC